MTNLPDLRVRLSEIRTYNTYRRDPLAFLEVLNIHFARDWTFDIRVSERMTPVLQVDFPVATEPTRLLDGTFSSVFDCSTLRLVNDSTEATFQLDRPALDESPLVMPVNRLVLEDFHSATFPSEWHQPGVIDRWLRRRTWLGSSFFEGTFATVTVRVMGQIMTFAPTVRAPSDLQLAADVLCLGKRIRIQVSSGLRRFQFRHAVLGVLDYDEDLRSVTDQLKRIGLTSGTVEFGPEWDFARGPLGTLQYRENLAQIRAELVELVASDANLRDIARYIDEEKHRVDTQKLNNRIAHARQAHKVVYKSRVLGKVPTSEAGAVAILHKLEALGGVPIEHFETVAWAAAEGIDAIAHIQLDDRHPVVSYAAVEYEFALDNFHRHQHPHEHVDMIICWEARDRGILMESDFRGVIEGPDGAIPVLVMSRFPGLSIIEEM